MPRTILIHLNIEVDDSDPRRYERIAEGLLKMTGQGDENKRSPDA